MLGPETPEEETSARIECYQAQEGSGGGGEEEGGRRGGGEEKEEEEDQ